MKAALFESQPSLWTERRELLPASMNYLFSLDLAMTSEAANAATLKTFAGRRDATPSTLRTRTAPSIGRLENLFAASSVNVSGTPRVPPAGSVTAASCTIDPVAPDGCLNLRGDFTVEIEGTQEPLLMAYSGVLTSSRPPRPTRKGEVPHLAPLLEGAVFLVSTQECAVPDLRWLIRAQLFGIGRVSSMKNKSLTISHRFSYDFYIDHRRPYPRLGRKVDGRYT